MQKRNTQKIEDNSENQINAENRHEKKTVAVYARVSQPIQKVHGDLQRQIERLEKHAEENNRKVIKCYKDVASGLNAKRRGLWKMMHDAAKGGFSELLVTFPDRLSRFGVVFIEQYLKIFDIGVTYIDPLTERAKANMQQELCDDLVAMIACFSGRLYGTRAKQNFDRDREKAKRLVPEFGKYCRDRGIHGRPEIETAQQFLKEKNEALMKRNMKFMLKQVNICNFKTNG